MSTAGANKCGEGMPAAGTLLSRLAGGYSMLTGSLVLAGWLTNVQSLKSVAPSFPTMNPTTATALLLAGLVLMARDERRAGWRTAVCRMAALAVFVMGLAKLADLLTGSALHADRIILAPLLRREAPDLNGMAPNTALALALLGTGLFLLETRVRSRRWLPGTLAIAAGLMGALSLVPFLFGIDASLGIASLTAMALHTAVAIMSLSAGLLICQPDHGVVRLLRSPHNGGRMARVLVPTVGLVVVGLGWLRIQGYRSGLYSDEFGTVLMTGSMVGVLWAIIWYVAATLDRVDANRARSVLDLDRARAVLHDKSELLQAILNSVGDGIVVIDSSGDTLHQNAAASRLLASSAPGKASIQWTGSPSLRMPDRTTPISFEKLALVRAQRGESVHDQEQYLAGSAGSPGTWLSVSAQPLSGWNGGAKGAVAVIRDISQRKTEELRLEENNDLLERMVDARTADLKHSNAELEQFAYVASHDLQEPLRMVGSFLQLLERRYKGRLDAKAEEYIAHAVDGATRMKQLINDLLQFSRVGRRGGEFADTSAEKAFGEAVADLGPAIAEANAEVTRGTLPLVRADPVQLRQVFQNLIGNALKFRGTDRPQIRVTAERTGELWRFAVADNGIGIEPQYFQQIFEVFQRLHDRATYPGTGIGLAVCKKIVDRHGGTLWVESSPGVGSTFMFTVPTAQGAAHVQRIAA
jgi:signal transduction histidine kinase